MKIERVEIDAFGHFQRRVVSLTPGLNLLHGNNEAGKSTLLAFVRAVLFGFEKRKSSARYEPEDGGPMGGELVLSTHFGRLRVRRRAGRKTEGELTVLGPDGGPLPEARLGDALAGISKELFYELFAFGLNELATFERLAAQGSVSEALFAAGMQGAQRLPAVMDDLRKSAEGLFKPGGMKPELNVVLDELLGTRARLREAGDRPALYVEASTRLAALEVEVAATERDLARAADERAGLDRLSRVVVDLEQVAAADAELASLPDLAGFPAGGAARLDELERRLAASRAERAEVAAKAAAVEEQQAALVDAKKPGAADEEVRAALDGFNARLAQFQALPGRRAQMDERHRQVDRALADLGLAIDGEALLGVDLGAGARGGLVALRERSAEAERQLALRDEAVKVAKAAHERIEEEVRRVTAEVAKLPVTPVADLRKKQAALARLPLTIEDALRLTARRSELCAAVDAQEALAEARPRQAFPAWALAVALLVLAGAGAAAVRAGLGATGLAVAGGAAALAVLLVVLQRGVAASFREQQAASETRTRVRDRELARVQAELSALDRREDDAHAAIAAAAAEAGLSEGPTTAQIDAAGAALAGEVERIESRSRLATELEQQAPRLAAASHAERDAKADRDVAEAGLSKLLREVDAIVGPRSLPKGLSAAAALDLWSEAAAVKGRMQDLAAEDKALRHDEKDCGKAAAAVVDAATGAGLREAASRGAESAAQALGVLLSKGQQAVAERRRLLERKEAIAADAARVARACAEAEGALLALLEKGGARDAEAFRTRAGQGERWAEASRRRREHGARVEAGAGLPAHEAREKVRQAGGAEGVAAKLAEASRRAGDLADQSKRLAGERGALSERVRGYEEDTEVGALRLAEETLAARAQDLADRYAVHRLALALLNTARRRFEEEQQPRVVRLASSIFSELSSGRYQKVHAATVGQDLAIRDIAGREWSAEKLSRGTRELLYFAFRLAVIEDFGETRLPLPVILDDILVNLDPERTRAAIAVLARLARRHQVIAFTCHPTLEPLFREQGANLVPLAPSAGEPR